MCQSSCARQLGKGKGGRRGDGPKSKRPSDDGARSEPSKRRKIWDHTRISEAEVGITQRLCPDVPQFRGVLKSRWTNFIVHEIAPDGQVTHLTNLNVDDAVKRDNFAKPKAAASDGAIAEGLEQLREPSSASDHGGFTTFYALVQRYEADRTEELRKSIPVDGFVHQQQHEKAERTRFHAVFKEHSRRWCRTQWSRPRRRGRRRATCACGTPAACRTPTDGPSRSGQRGCRSTCTSRSSRLSSTPSRPCRCWPTGCRCRCGTSTLRGRRTRGA